MYFWRIVPLAFVVTIACGGYSGSTGPTGGGQMSNPLPPGTVGVNIRDFSFTPASLTVKVGTTVRWTNQGPSGHTTTSDTGVWGSATLGAPSGGGGYGNAGSAGGTFNFRFTQAGTFPYHCSLHPPSAYPGFTGTVTVTQ